MKRIFIAFLLYYATTMAMELDKDELLENRVPCLDKSLRYRKRPESLMKIRTQVAVLSINSISSAKMELSADVYLTHDWVDNRCWWRPLKGKPHDHHHQSTRLDYHFLFISKRSRVCFDTLCQTRRRLYMDPCRFE